MIEVDKCKFCCNSCRVRYRIRSGNVFVCDACGFHQLDFLDEYAQVVPEIDKSELTDELRQYIETQLQSSECRFDNHLSQLQKLMFLDDKRLLDVGCGGGLFLKKARDLGVQVTGIELDNGRAAYCQQKHQLDIVKQPIESEYWNDFQSHFDAVTIWDVIEHVNDPLATLKASSRLLKPGGIMLLDTPARDSFYHRVGAFTYAASLGKFPTLLNAMYSNHPFGHKQILSTCDARRLIESAGLQVISIHKMHELSFPYVFYLRKILRSNVAAKLVAPMASLFFKVFQIQNKMVVSARRV